MEELWDWCCTEVMRLDNGKDVWKQINKVHKFAKEEVKKKCYQEIREMVKKFEDDYFNVGLKMDKNYFDQLIQQLNVKIKK